MKLLLPFHFAINFLRKKKFEYSISKKNKIFCIGRNKTGTTSLKIAFKELGFTVGNQRKAELLNDDYFNGNFDAIIEYCKSAQVFQDVPFSWPQTYKHLDKAFPGSKFILTVRDNSDQWYNSVVNFQSKIRGGGEIPSVEDIKNDTYVYKGWAWSNKTRMHNITENDDPYDKKMLVSHYEKHNADVLEYFKGREKDLLVLNLSDSDAYQKFCAFIGVTTNKTSFPWENKTSELPIK